MKVDPSLIHRLFYPQVPLVMSAKSGGRVSAMPVVSYSLVSDSPPIVAVACKPEGFTCKLALKAKAFSLSVLSRSRTSSISLLSTTSGEKIEDKLRAAGFKHHDGQEVRAPVIDDAEATLECRLKSTSKVGDHLLLFGEVRKASASDSFSDFWDFRKYRPVLYTGWREGLSTYPEG